MKKFIKVFLYLLLVVAMVFLVLIVTATLSDYRPRESEILYESSEAQIVPTWTEIDLMIWNIGYGGLDKSMDFFYDGGKQVRTSKENLTNNMNAILKLLEENDTIEYFLLQEVDVNSHRSYNINQYDSIKSVLNSYWSFYGKNYDVFFVPVPFTQPLGPVESGLQTLSRARPSSSVRMRFPGNYAWPKSLFMLDRCFLVNRYKLNNNKELLIINTHNSAYDDGSLRKMQMEYLKKYLLVEFEKGNYIITGGDWNQCPPAFIPQYQYDKFDTIDYSIISEDFLPVDWTWAYNPTSPTNRRLLTPYTRGESPATTIDFYLLSPNIYLMQTKCSDLEFEHSDHQPVRMKVKLMN